MKCEICEKECSLNGLSAHIKRIHPDIKHQDYYDKYLGTQKFCKTCGQPTSYIGGLQGYEIYCNLHKQDCKEYICKVCGKKVKSLCHIKEHKITAQQYYDSYFKKEGEGICPICNKPTPFLSIANGYQKHCSITCAMRSEDKKEKSKQTCQIRYGADNPWKSKICQEKQKETMQKRYGVSNAFNIPEVKEKAIKNSHTTEATQKKKETSQLHYGTDYPLQSKEIREQIKQTNIEKYGATNPMCHGTPIRLDMENKVKDQYGGLGFASPEINNKVKQTKQQKYNDENYNNRDKASQTMLEKYNVITPLCDSTWMKEANIKKYGVDSNMKSKEGYEEYKKGVIKKYGVDHILKVPEIQEKIWETRHQNDKLDQEIDNPDE